MATIILPTDLDNYPGVTATEGQIVSAVERANALVTDAWKSPVDPAPQWVVEIALAAVSRFLANPRGLSSWTQTRSIDDGSRSQTERASDSTPVRPGLYLTDDEAARLAGVAMNRRRVGSIRLGVPGF